MNQRILTVEDNNINRRILYDLLTNSGYEVIEAKTGDEGVALATEKCPDLILMDIQIPGFDGYEATRRIKNIPRLREIPVIAVTSYAFSGDEEKSLEAGCVAHITKPFSPRKVLSMIRRYLPVE